MSFDKVWEQVHAERDYGHIPDVELVGFLSRKYSETKNLKALDLGCGQGGNAILLAELGFNVTAVDSSPSAIGKLYSTAKEKGGLSIELITCDLSSLEFQAQSFDLIVDISTLEGLPKAEVKIILDTARYWLKPDGVFFSRMFTKPFDPKLLLKNHKELVNSEEVDYLFSNYSAFYSKIPSLSPRDNLLVTHYYIVAYPK